MTRHLSSEQARAHWRETLDAVAAGERIVIERYGRPVAVLAPYAERPSAELREPGPIYDSPSYERLKTEVVAEVIAELGAAQMEPVPWLEGLTKLQDLVRDSGSPFTEMTTDEIVEQMRETRREVVEELYGHLYR
jgi:prevent-host-death family protein